MREILFRGKRVDNGEWVYGDLLHPDLYGNGYSIEDFTKEKGNCFDVIPETVGQYVMTDSIGNKIFEGDIVKGTDQLEKELEVYGYIDHKNGSFVIVGDFMTHYRWLDYDVEVIGNIHDNSELLKGGAE